MSDEQQPAQWAMDYVLNKKRRRCDCLSCVAIEASALEASAVGEVMRAAAAVVAHPCKDCVDKLGAALARANAKGE